MMLKMLNAGAVMLDAASRDGTLALCDAMLPQLTIDACDHRAI